MSMRTCGATTTGRISFNARIERLFWFNPLVWIVGRRIALEREIASDDAVVEKTGEAHAYATSLWRLAREMRMPSMQSSHLVRCSRASKSPFVSSDCSTRIAAASIVRRPRR